jgi:hypothetical protein
LLVERNQNFLLDFGDEPQRGAQARQRQIYYSRYVRNGHGNGHRPNGRG